MASSWKSIVMDPKACSADDLERKLGMAELTSGHECYKYDCPHCECEFKGTIALESISPL